MDAISINLVLVLVLVLIGSLVTCGRLAKHWLTKPTTIRITGRIPDVEEWLPRAMRRSAVAHYSSARWGSQTLISYDRNRRITGYLGVLLGNQGDYRVEVELPPYSAGTHFTTDLPLLATVTLSCYCTRPSLLRLLFLGRYPDKIAIAARARVIRQLKKHARLAAKELSLP